MSKEFLCRNCGLTYCDDWDCKTKVYAELDQAIRDRDEARQVVGDLADWLEEETPQFDRAALLAQCPWLRPGAKKAHNG